MPRRYQSEPGGGAEEPVQRVAASSCFIRVPAAVRGNWGYNLLDAPSSRTFSTIAVETRHARYAMATAKRSTTQVLTRASGNQDRSWPPLHRRTHSVGLRRTKMAARGFEWSVLPILVRMPLGVWSPEGDQNTDSRRSNGGKILGSKLRRTPNSCLGLGAPAGRPVQAPQTPRG